MKSLFSLLFTVLFSSSVSAHSHCEDYLAAAAAEFNKEALATLLKWRNDSPLDEAYQRVHQWITTQQALARDPDRPVVSIVIPAYREEQRLPGSIERMRKFFDRYPLPIEILVIVEKSPDNTVTVGQAAAAGDPRIQVIDNIVQKGKGFAVRSGMRRAQGEIQLFMDADLSTHLVEIIYFLDHLRAHPEIDILIGDRTAAIAGSERALHRQVMSHAFKSVVRAVSPGHWPDTQAGFKMFRKSAAQQIFAHQVNDRFAFDVEVLTLAHYLGYTTVSLPIFWVDDARSTVSPLRDSSRMFMDVLRIRREVRRRLQNAAPSSVGNSW